MRYATALTPLPPTRAVHILHSLLKEIDLHNVISATQSLCHFRVCLLALESRWFRLYTTVRFLMNDIQRATLILYLLDNI